jgi:hypothetical protein
MVSNPLLFWAMQSVCEQKLMNELTLITNYTHV